MVRLDRFCNSDVSKGVTAKDVFRRWVGHEVIYLDSGMVSEPSDALSREELIALIHWLTELLPAPQIRCALTSYLSQYTRTDQIGPRDRWTRSGSRKIRDFSGGDFVSDLPARANADNVATASTTGAFRG